MEGLGFHKHAPLQHAPPKIDESLNVVEFSSRATGCSWHFHPEHQLSVVANGTGKRMVGDAISPIEPGEVTLLGSNLPHVWRYDPSAEPVHAVVVHFNDDFAGNGFLDQPEMRSLRLLLARSHQGLQAHGEARLKAASLLLDLPRQHGFDRLLAFLSILHTLASDSDLTTIASQGVANRSHVDLERLRCVYAYLDEHLDENITREEIAAVAHLSPTAFSRFFRQHAGLTFQECLLERRIARSCEELHNLSLSITEVAHQSGFSSSASYTRAFRRVKGVTPSTYRQQIAEVLKIS